MADTPIYVRGAYFVWDGPKSKNIDFFILDPKGKVVFSRRNKDEGIFRFNTTMPGSYAFVFSNMRDKIEGRDLSIAIHTPGNDDEDFDQDAAAPKEMSDEDKEELESH